MLLSKLIQGLGALSLVHVAFAAEEPVYKRTNETENSGEAVEVQENVVAHWCTSTMTVTTTETKTMTEKHSAAT
jgi:hypothetical protein